MLPVGRELPRHAHLHLAGAGPAASPPLGDACADHRWHQVPLLLRGPSENGLRIPRAESVRHVRNCVDPGNGVLHVQRLLQRLHGARHQARLGRAGIPHLDLANAVGCLRLRLAARHGQRGGSAGAAGLRLLGRNHRRPQHLPLRRRAAPAAGARGARLAEPLGVLAAAEPGDAVAIAVAVVAGRAAHRQPATEVGQHPLV
mmetsp:Transcript_33496/g.96156  ORF Transcript_33496/g.96156 Transcript_33496/m.96156 type:complete len:201 (-) Transcript_33496:577-1179(-)